MGQNNRSRDCQILTTNELVITFCPSPSLPYQTVENVINQHQIKLAHVGATTNRQTTGIQTDGLTDRDASDSRTVYDGL